MFTGIIEALATIESVKQMDQNRQYVFRCWISEVVKVDQSIAHNGVCLTVIQKDNETYTVDAIAETLEKTNMSDWKVGDKINLERSVTLNQRLDGHIVQGHVDQTLKCIGKENEGGSWRFTFSYPKKVAALLIPKGSISINGVSLTIADLQEDQFSVAIIPYTYGHTNFHQLEPGDTVNIEFDMVGKYINRIAKMNA